jgi:hypothetical protein
MRIALDYKLSIKKTAPVWVFQIRKPNKCCYFFNKSAGDRSLDGSITLLLRSLL